MQSLLATSSVKPVGQFSKHTWKAVPGYLKVPVLHTEQVVKYIGSRHSSHPGAQQGYLSSARVSAYPLKFVLQQHLSWSGALQLIE